MNLSLGNRALRRFDRLPLLGVQALEIVARGRVDAGEVADAGGWGVGQPSAAFT